MAHQWFLLGLGVEHVEKQVGSPLTQTLQFLGTDHILQWEAR